MKKFISLILAVIMMFSMTSVSYATDTTVGTETSATTTIDNYMDYFEEKLEDDDTNFFVRIVIRVVIIFVFIGFIDVEDFDDWFENTAPDIDTDTDSDNTTEDNNSNNDWEDGTEVTLHHAQALPYTENGVTITDIKVTKEHFDGLDKNNSIINCKYNFEIHGKCSEYNDGDYLYMAIKLEKAHYIFSLKSGNGNNFEISDDGTFVWKDTHYSEYDSSRFSINELACYGDDDA